MDDSQSPRIPYMQVLLGGFVAVFTGLLLYSLLSVQPNGRILIGGLTLLGVLGIAMGLSPLLRLFEDHRSFRRREQRFQDSLRLSQDVLLEWDAHRQGLLQVEAAGPFQGYGPWDFQALSMDRAIALVHPDDLPSLMDSLDRAGTKEPGNPVPGEIRENHFRVKTPKGEWRWCRLRWEVQERDGQGAPRRILGAAWDITDQRKCEVALVQAQRFESLGVLAGGIAHEFNNILMGIQGHAELALETRNPDGRTSFLDRILEGTQRASNLCQQMLAYSGRGKHQIVRHQLNESLAEIQPLVERMLPTGIVLRLDPDRAVPPIMADPNQVRHALLNLILNAMDALGTGPGEIVLRTRLQRLDRAPVGVGSTLQRELTGHFVCLEVEDTGSGMTEATLNRIFDPFFSTRYPGRGLGLPTVLGITRSHQANISVESTPGQGSRVTLYFPAAELQEEIELPSVSGAVAAGAPATPARSILLVDDEPTIRSIMSQGLVRAGFRVIEAADGVDGFGAFVRHRSELCAVLLDLTMPRMGGRELFEEIHRLAPEMPVILMSGYAEYDALRDLEGSGLRGFLPKPCSMKEAVRVVRGVLPPVEVP